MKVATGKLQAIAGNPWFVTLAGIASIISFIWFMFEKLSNQPYILSSIFLFISLIILFSAYIYSIKVRTENIALREIAGVFNKINHIYRDTLRDMFSSEEPTTDPGDLLVEERNTLLSVCQRASYIFSRVIGHECMVTIKLLTEENNKKFAQTYVRSLEKCERDKQTKIKYEVGTGENTAFDRAVIQRTDDRPSHYYSGDLTKENGYSNQRQHFKRFYRSTIVVPIRGKNKGKEGTHDEYDMVGYLCVDTKSLNRLKNDYHLQMLSSLAGQMYNFMSLMRGKYTVMVG